MSQHTSPSDRTRFFTIRPGVDGVDETFEIVCRETGKVVAHFGYWEAREAALRGARQFTAALNAFYRFGAYIEIESFAEAHEIIDQRYLQPTVHDATAEAPCNDPVDVDCIFYEHNA